MLAIAGGKGGVGRTTCALALGAALGRAGREVLVVDADGDGDLVRLAGLERTGRSAAGGSVETRARSLPDRPGVSVLAGDRGSARTATLATAAEWSGPVVLDCPARPGAAAPVLRAADHTMLVTTPRPTARVDAARIGVVAARLGTPTVGALVTHTAEPPAAAAPVEGPILAGVPEADRPLSAPAVQETFDRLAADIV